MIRGITRFFGKTRAYLLVVYTAARKRPLIIGVSIHDGTVHATSDQPIVLGEMASIRNSTIRSRMYVAGDYVAVLNNTINLREEP